MYEETVDGWRLLVHEYPAEYVYFDNKPLVEVAKAEGKGEPPFMHFEIPEADIRPLAHILHEDISMAAYDRARTLIRGRLPQ